MIVQDDYERVTAKFFSALGKNEFQFFTILAVLEHTQLVTNDWLILMSALETDLQGQYPKCRSGTLYKNVFPPPL